ncbi:hypothetical protein [Streptomyces tendae]|uniref:hypothetical protein n=1 Tax=Streptomyces tendae TaxID=1932 RepID=UPI00248F6E02|nr:hypothetical protein [Streptomyces tendae]
MIWSAALPGAALRVLRTAAGRRALHVALLVGGLCVLGLLCGGRAHAADEEPGSLKDAVGRVLDVSAQTRSRPPAAGSARAAEAVPGPGSGALLPDLRPVTENLVRTVDDRVVRPVGDVVATVATVTEGARLRGPSGPTDPSGRVGVPDLVDVPDLIDLSGLRDVPDPGGGGESSGSARPAVPDPPADPAPTVTDTSRPADPSDAAHTSDAADTPVAGGAGTPARVVGYGPESGVGAAPDAHPRTHRAAGSAHTEYAAAHPAHPAPHGDPDGTLGTASGADQGTPRHGDTRAVAPQYRFTFRLVPGAVERSGAAGAREPYRDIPVSPA